MKLPPELRFHEEKRLLIYRPWGLLNESAINEVLSALEDLEAALKEPFNRFLDTLAADEVELNFKIHYSDFSSSSSFLHRSTGGEVSNSGY